MRIKIHLINLKDKIISLIKAMLTREFWALHIKNIPVYLKTSLVTFLSFSSFFLLLILFLFGQIFSFLKRIKGLGRIALWIDGIWQRKFKNKYNSLISRIEGKRKSEVKRLYLINLAFQNLMVKKNRSIITILGMSFGVGIIVLLLSFGYGIERLVIGKIATLNEMKVVDVSAGGSSALRLGKDAIEKIKLMSKVDQVLPVVSVVGRVDYNKATTDILVYGVTSSYLQNTSLKLKSGKYFEDELAYYKAKEPQVAGAKINYPLAKYNTKTGSDLVEFNILPEEPATVWENCSINSDILGYTTRLNSGYKGVEYWGGEYSPFSEFGRVAYDENSNRYLGRWVKAKVLLSSEVNDKFELMVGDDGREVWKDGCIQVKEIQINNQYKFSQVLGISTDVLGEATPAAFSNNSVVTIATQSGGIELVEINASGSATTKIVDQIVNYSSVPKAQALVSLGMLSILNISEKQAIGTTFSTSYILVNNIMPEIKGKAQSIPQEYTIVGVIDDVNTPYFYVPISDLQKLGVTNFSQAKVILKDKNEVVKIRKEIETLGYRTTSTTDTVKQVEDLFNSLRFLLALLGLVALGVACLGMFNTLTVSLLERTREIGGMKTMGMVSDEIQDLFLAEAMIMGLGGGLGGLILGFLVGKAVSLVISVFSLASGQGFLNLTYTPSYLVAIIIISSFFVGAITGLYPAKRAKKTSALNALRYE